MKKYIYCFITALVAVFFVSCEKVSDLSDYATITAFKVNSKSVEDVKLGEAIIRNDSIIIPVDYGKYLFPLTIEGTPVLDGDDARILNINFAEKQEFQTIDASKVFYVAAASGLTKKWVICFEASSSSEETDIVSFKIVSYTPSDAIISAPVFVRTQSAVYTMVIAGETPITIVPKIETSPGSKIVDYKDGDPLVYTELGTAKKMVVQSASGRTKDWNVGMYRSTPVVEGVTSPEIIARLAIPENSFSAVSESEQADYTVTRVSFDGYNIKLSVQPKDMTNTDVKFPVKLKLSFSTDPNAQSISVKSGDVLTFNSWSDLYNFYTLDNLSATYASWNISITPIANNEANVEKFTINSYSSADNKMELSKDVVINKTAATVTIPIIKNVYAMPVTVSSTVMVSAGAKTEPTLPPTITFNALNSKYQFTVVSSQGDRKDWTVVLRDDTNLSKEAEVLSFKINDQFPKEAVYLEKSKAQITVVTPQKTNLRFIPTISVSPGATLSGIVSGAELPEDLSFTTDKTFEVIAQDGTAKQWRIKLIYAPQLVGTALNAITPPWATANNSVVEGTFVVNRGSGKAIQMVTKEQNTFLFGKVMAAGTFFTGSFDFNLSTTGIDYPRTMTHFGIPFEAKPVGFNIDVKYQPGPVLKQAVKKDPNSPTSGSNSWSIKDISGTDNAQIFVELVNYNGDISKVPDSYSGDGKNGKGQPVSGLTMLGKGEILSSGTSGQWINAMPKDITYGNTTMPVTHIVVVMSSSSQGDKYIGAPSSTLEVNNLKLNYYIPASDAVLQ